MSGWVKVPESWFEDESVEALPADVVLVHLSALAYCARHSTNGRVPANAVRRLWQAGDAEAAIQHLITSGFWFPLSTGDWQIREWETFILSAVEVERRRAVSRATSERYRLHKLGDHSMCDRCAAVRKARDTSPDTSPDTSVTLSVTRSPNRTDPTRRGGEGEGAHRALPLVAHEPADDCCPLPLVHPVHDASKRGQDEELTR